MHQKPFFIRPATGLTLRDPETQEPLPAEGAFMPRSAFWLRRLKSGDVALVVGQPAPAEQQPNLVEAPPVTAPEPVTTATKKGK